MSDGAGSQAWSYDQMGRVWKDRRTTNSVTRNFPYLYNLDGSIASITYPSGRRIDYAPGGAGLPLSAIDSGTGTNYATSASYAPHQVLAGLTNGAGIASSFGYNKRLQPTTICVTAPGGTRMSLSYNLNLGSADNGNVMGITNTLNGNRSQTFTYDALNRIATASTATWSQTFNGMDIWANLYHIDAAGGVPGLNVSANAKNHLDGFGYDLAGNMTSDGLYSYNYDAENRITTTAGVGYTYDGDGRRVMKSNGKLYWYGVGGEALTETDAGGNNPTEYVFFNGRRIARREASGAVYYYFSDHLGSSRVITDANGIVCYDADFTPYGYEIQYVNTCPQNYKFTGKERDTESGNDYFLARQYASKLGPLLYIANAMNSLFQFGAGSRSRRAHG